MGIYILGVGSTSSLITYAGTTLTDHVESVEINYSYDQVEVTSMNATSKAYAPGLRDDEITINFYQDFASASVDATINSYVGSSTGATLVIQTSGSTVSTTNPKYTFVCAPFEYQPLSGKVGEASMTSVKFKGLAGSAITRATS